MYEFNIEVVARNHRRYRKQ